MAQPNTNLDQISTRWPAISDPVQFTMRYAPAIRGYLHALMGDADAADETAQDFLLRGLEVGFLRTPELRGRFRDYLKAAVRNAALSRLRRRRRPEKTGMPAMADFAAPEQPSD